jgi:hypothetical protein
MCAEKLQMRCAHKSDAEAVCAKLKAMSRLAAIYLYGFQIIMWEKHASFLCLPPPCEENCIYLFISMVYCSYECETWYGEWLQIFMHPDFVSEYLFVC